MATCGYLCPQCEGRGFIDSGDVCDWCSTVPATKQKPSEEELNNWIESVHQSPCCGDLGQKENDQC
jgi:hypothetical protein